MCPSPSKNNLPNVQNEGGGKLKGVLNNVKKNCRISKEVHPLQALMDLNMADM